MTSDARFALVLNARVCHDLSGLVGSLGGLLDLLPEDDGEVLTLSRDTTRMLRQRLQLYAAAFAAEPEGQDVEGLRTLLAGAPAAPRVGFDLAGVAPGATLPGTLAQLVLNAGLLGAEALPRGGTVHLVGQPAEGFVVLPEGRDAAWPACLLRIVAGAAPCSELAAGPRRVIAPMLATLAAAAGWGLSLGLGGAGLPPLLLSPLA